MSLLLLFNQAGGGGATAYTLACTNGAYPWGGVAATLGFNRKLPAVTGNYAYLGKAAVLGFTRKLPASVGAYPYAGKAAGFTLGRKLSAEVGNYAYTGKAATFTFGRKLPALNGSYPYAGRAASFTLARKLAANSGNYAYSGKAATFTHVRIVWPAPAQVLLGVQYGPTGTDYTGVAVGGSGEGTVFASMFSVQIEQPSLTISQRAKRQAPEAQVVSPPIRQSKSPKHVAVFSVVPSARLFTAPDEITITQTTQAVVLKTQQPSATIKRKQVS